MTIRRGDRPERFVIVDNNTIRRKDLSFRARGLLAYLLSMPADWKTNAARLAKQSPLEGRDAILTALKELEHAGFLHRHRYQDSAGRWHTENIVVENPVEKCPSYPLPETDEPNSVNPYIKEIPTTKDLSASSSTHSYERDPFCTDCRGTGWTPTDTETTGIEKCSCRSRR